MPGVQLGQARFGSSAARRGTAAEPRINRASSGRTRLLRAYRSAARMCSAMIPAPGSWNRPWAVVLEHGVRVGGQRDDVDPSRHQRLPAEARIKEPAGRLLRPVEDEDAASVGTGHVFLRRLIEVVGEQVGLHAGGHGIAQRQAPHRLVGGVAHAAHDAAVRHEAPQREGPVADASELPPQPAAAQRAARQQRPERPHAPPVPRRPGVDHRQDRHLVARVAQLLRDLEGDLAGGAKPDQRIGAARLHLPDRRHVARRDLAQVARMDAGRPPDPAPGSRRRAGPGRGGARRRGRCRCC